MRSSMQEPTLHLRTRYKLVIVRGYEEVHIVNIVAFHRGELLRSFEPYVILFVTCIRHSGLLRKPEQVAGPNFTMPLFPPLKESVYGLCCWRDIEGVLCERHRGATSKKPLLSIHVWVACHKVQIAEIKITASRKKSSAML
jgi:hypothetical protein